MEIYHPRDEELLREMRRVRRSDRRKRLARGLAVLLVLSVAFGLFVFHRYYQLAVMHHAAGDPAGAERSLKKSLDLRESAWAFRALARLDLAAGRTTWRDKYLRALSLQPRCEALLKEYAEALLKAGLCRELTAFLDGLPDGIKALPRFQFLRAAGCVGTGDFSEAERILLKPLVLPDIREGELSLSEIWSRLWEKKEGLTREEAAEKHPLPPALDFRMH